MYLKYLDSNKFFDSNSDFKHLNIFVRLIINKPNIKAHNPNYTPDFAQ